MKYESLEAAQEALKSNVDVIPFCPITKSMCRWDCVCYVRAMVVSNARMFDPPSSWWIKSGYCNNHMFHGEGVE